MAVLRVAHVWGDRLLDVRHLAGDGAVGPLVRSKGRIRMNDEAISVREGHSTRLVLGETELLLEYIEPQPPPVASTEDDDWHFVKIAGCLLVAFVALVAMLLIDAQLGFASDDPGVPVPIVYRKILAQPPPPKKPALDLAAAQKKQLEPTKPPLAPGHRAAKPLEVKQAGLLGLLADPTIGDNLFAGGLNPGIDRALNGLNGPAGADASGGGLGGPRGFGPSGEGLGMRPGAFGLRRGPLGVGGELRKKLDVGPCCAETQVSDGLSKDLIGKVIRRHFSEIKFCYERQLQQNGALAGKVVVLFTIDAAGAVVDANVAESSIEDANVESCILSRVRTWKFPEPRGRGIVSVSHPWFFKAAGSDD